MQVGRAGQPREERGVLHRVPRPVAAPPQDLVRPPGAQQDPHRQAAPGHERPAAGLQQPALPHATRGQRRHRQGERHGEAHIAQVEHRRVERHEDVVLEQWVGARAVVAGPRLEAGERVGRTGQQEEEEGAHHEQHQQCPAHDGIVQPVSEPPYHQHHVAHQDQDPQQDRPLERRPEGGHVEQGRGAVAAVFGHERNGEVAGDERSLHDRHLTDRGDGHQGHPGTGPHHEDGITGREAPGHAEQAGHRGGQPEGDECRTEGGVQPVSPQGSNSAPSER